jgi:hypothetical protein
MALGSPPAGTTLHWYKEGWRHDARITYDDKETLLCFISFPRYWRTWEVDMFTDQSQSRKLMHMTKPASWGKSKVTFEDHVSNASFVMTMRSSTVKFDFEYSGTVYAWRQASLMSSDRTLLRYPAKTEVALYDAAGLALNKVGKIHVQPRSELPLHIIAGTLYMMHAIEEEEDRQRRQLD